MKAILLILLFVPLYAQEWDPVDYTLAGFFVTTQIMDYALTNYGIKNGAVEKNPFFGKRPKMEHIVLAKTVGTALVLYLTTKMNYTERKLFYFVANAIMIAVIYNNIDQVGFNLRLTL